MSWDPHYPAELTLLPKSESQPTCTQFQHWIDFENLELHVTRSIWHQVVGNCKTEASAKPVPMDSYMAEDLLRWHSQSTYASDDDYVFASATMGGEQPYLPDNLMKRCQFNRSMQHHLIS
jgi:hypothetical protein